jgi:uncharacterized membrane protein YedE/YeeE
MVHALIGGALIGVAVSLMLLFNGRVTGISGIIGGVVKPTLGDLSWRVFFVLGLISGGLILKFFNPGVFEIKSSAHSIDYIIAGLFVGFGTLLGNGCTSGHGVCGISRFSVRSIFSTLTFITFGVLSVLVFKMLRGSL